MVRVVKTVWATLAIASAAMAAGWAYVGQWGSPGSGDGQFNEPKGIAVASNYTVYVADVRNHRVQYFTSNGSFLGKWGSYGTGNGQFEYAHGVAAAPNGTVFVADWWRADVQYFSPTGSFLGKWGSYGSGMGQFEEPSGIAISVTGARAYVADQELNRVQYFNRDKPAVSPTSLGRVKAVFR